MSRPDTLYTNGLLLWGTIATDPFQWLLVDDTYVPDADADIFVADLTGEYTGGAYTRQTLTTPTVTPATGVEAISCDAPSFGTDNDSVHLVRLVLAEDTGSDATSNLIAAWLIERTTDGTTFAAAINPGGILAVTANPNEQLIPT